MPYTFWVVADPAISAIVQKSLAEYRHELLVDNFAGIPILDQHGSTDDNVPVFHSRRMLQLTSETSSPINYIELPDKGHWYDGVMTTSPLRDFYNHILNDESLMPYIPRCFSMVVRNPGDMGSRHGLVVDQLISPDQNGKIEVERHESTSTWAINTSNILRFHFAKGSDSSNPHHLNIDRYTLHISSTVPRDECQSFARSKNGSWEVRSTFYLTENVLTTSRCRTIVTGVPSDSDMEPNLAPLVRSSAHAVHLRLSCLILVPSRLE